MVASSDVGFRPRPGRLARPRARRRPGGGEVVATEPRSSSASRPRATTSPERPKAPRDPRDRSRGGDEHVGGAHGLLRHVPKAYGLIFAKYRSSSGMPPPRA